MEKQEMKPVVATLLATLVLAAGGAGYASAAASKHQSTGSWYALADDTDQCYAADRQAGAVEQQLAGPFKSEADASKAVGGMPGCADLWKGD
jgi:hypothetical protein